MTRTIQFRLGRVENIVQRSREIGSNEEVVVGVREAEVICACGHKWVATEGKDLQNVFGGIHLTCPACKASEVTHARLLRAP
jgi:hypothetical protein